MTELSEPLLAAPVGLVVLNEQDNIVAANRVASSLGLVVGTPMASYISHLEETFYDAVRHEPETRTWLFRFDEREKRFSISCSKGTGRLYVWLHDLSEQLALAEKVRQMKDPGSRRLRQINHQASTALGYTELLEVIMEDHQVLTAEKLGAVKQYQSEVAASLQKIQQIAQQNREDHKNVSTSILVAEGHGALSELITELLRAEGYRVNSFCDAGSALKFFSLNSHAISKAIVDESLKNEDDVLLVTALRELAPALDIVTLTDETGSSSRDCIQKPVDFQMLLRAVED